MPCFTGCVALRAPIPPACVSRCALSVILRHTRVLVRLCASRCIISQTVSHDSGTEFLNISKCLDNWFRVCVWAILCPAVGEWVSNFLKSNFAVRQNLMIIEYLLLPLDNFGEMKGHYFYKMGWLEMTMLCIYYFYN